MTIKSTSFASRTATRAGTAALTALLTLTVSHHALAACAPAPTAGNDTVTCSDAQNGSVNLLTGDDKITINSGAVFSASSANSSVTGGPGSDLIVINGGIVNSGAPGFNYDLTAGTGTTAVSDVDNRIFMFDGTLTGGEVQVGAGTNNFFFFMGGTIQPNAAGRGSLEINRGSTNAVVVFDGGTLTTAEGFEFQSGNATVNAGPKDPTIYLRSGLVQATELELSATSNTGTNPTNVTLVIDPFNSQAAGAYKTLANAATNGADPTLGTAALNSALFTYAKKVDPQMTLKVPEVSFGAGNDVLKFDGAINNGDTRHNLILQGTEESPGDFEITEFDGGDGTDKIIVTGASGLGSNLILGEIAGFEELLVDEGSELNLTETSYVFTNSIKIDGGSVLQFSSPGEVVVATGELTIEEGSVLKVGSAAAEVDDDEAAALAAPQALTNLVINGDGSTVTNNGTIDMIDGNAGNTTTVNDHYVSNNGNLAIETVLGGTGSPTDQLIVNGPPVTGTTTVLVTNLGGTGGFTGSGPTDGIAVATSGTGSFAADSFRLATNALTGREEVVAGAFSYRLAVNDDAALLQSDILDQVPAYATAPSVGQRLTSSGLDTLYKRLGEIRTGVNGGATSQDGLVWVRGSTSDVDVDPNQGFGFSQRVSGVLAGIGGVTTSSDQAGAGRLAFGVFGSYGTADANVNASIFGAASRSSVDANSYGAGVYATYYELGAPGTGLYVDTVFKVDRLDYDMAAGIPGASGSTDGDAFTGSGEVGYGIDAGGGFVIQPQAQLTYTNLSLQGFEDAYDLDVSYGTSTSLVGRLGLQVQANIVQAGGGLISPYAIFNVYNEFEGDNDSRIAGTQFVSDIGGTWYSAGGGINAKLAEGFSLYGSAEYNFGDVEGWGGTGGAKLQW